MALRRPQVPDALAVDRAEAVAERRAPHPEERVVVVPRDHVELARPHPRELLGGEPIFHPARPVRLVIEQMCDGVPERELVDRAVIPRARARLRSGEARAGSGSFATHAGTAGDRGTGLRDGSRCEPIRATACASRSNRSTTLCSNATLLCRTLIATRRLILMFSPS
jgi:hypothetical protein